MITPKNIRVAHVSSAHRWSDNRVHLREAASLVAAGYDVHLIAVEHDIDVPETGVKVTTIPERSRLSRFIVGSLQAIWLAIRSRATIVHLHDPELVWAVPLLRAMRRIVIFDAHEDLPSQVLGKHYLGPRQARITSWFARLVVSVAGASNHVVAATETIAERFSPSKTTVVHNYPRLREEDAHAPAVNDRPAKVVYIGAISEERGSNQMVDAFSSPAFPSNWGALIAGTTSPASLLESLQKRPGWARVDFRGQIGPLAARELLNDARVGLLVLQRNRAYVDSLPTKMFEYLAAGVPVVASDFPLWRSIIEKYNCGLLVDETDPNAIAQAIARYASDPELLRAHSESAQDAARTQLNWTEEETALLRTYARLVSKG